MVILGAALPALLLLVVTWFAWRGFGTAVQQSNAALTQRALESNRFAAQYVARTTGSELDRRFAAVRHMAESQEFIGALTEALANPEIAELLSKLSDPQRDEAELEQLRKEFRRHKVRETLRKKFVAWIPPEMLPPDAVASWFFCDANGLSVVREPPSQTIGKDYAWRSYFHGGPADEEKTWRPAEGEHLDKIRLSAVFRSQATQHWIVAVSAPVFA